jgi:pimeloyl-ACP methyl ester carboxylesterase
MARRAWAWDRVVPLLEAAGHRAIAFDLPGQGEDETPLELVTLDAYAQRTCRQTSAQSEPVILVGHSLGGNTISQAAQNCPETVRALVYVSAGLLRDGENGEEWLAERYEFFAPYMTMSDDGVYSAVVQGKGARKALYGASTTEDVDWAMAQLGPQPMAVLSEPVSLSADRYGTVPRYYIGCERDGLILPSIQRAMVAASPCKEVLSLDTDHSPALSMSEGLVQHLLYIAGA